MDAFMIGSTLDKAFERRWRSMGYADEVTRHWIGQIAFNAPNCFASHWTREAMTKIDDRHRCERPSLETIFEVLPPIDGVVALETWMDEGMPWDPPVKVTLAHSLKRLRGGVAVEPADTAELRAAFSGFVGPQAISVLTRAFALLARAYCARLQNDEVAVSRELKRLLGLKASTALLNSAMRAVVVIVLGGLPVVAPWGPAAFPLRIMAARNAWREGNLQSRFEHALLNALQGEARDYLTRHPSS